MGSSSVDICQKPPAEDQLAIAYYLHENSSFKGSTGATNRVQYSSNLLLKLNDKWAVGFGHRSTILNIDDLALQTNGYLHTFFFPVHMARHNGDRSFRLSVAPALSGSSNVVKDTGEYTRDAFQLLAAAVWTRPLSNRLRLSYGVCGDHRLGGYRVYPAVGLDWRHRSDWRVELGFPASQLTYAATRTIDLSLRLSPNGSEWYVKSKDLEQSSKFVYEAYVLESALSWQLHQDFRLTASVAREFDGRYKMTLFDGSRVQLSSESAGRVGVALAWRF
jgi:hypothetical protein